MNTRRIFMIAALFAVLGLMLAGCDKKDDGAKGGGGKFISIGTGGVTGVY